MDLTHHFPLTKYTWKTDSKALSLLPLPLRDSFRALFSVASQPPHAQLSSFSWLPRGKTCARQNVLLVIPLLAPLYFCPNGTICCFPTQDRGTFYLLHVFFVLWFTDSCCSMLYCFQVLLSWVFEGYFGYCKPPFLLVFTCWNIVKEVDRPFVV